MLSDDVVEMLRVAVAATLDKKAFQVEVLDLSQLTSFTDSFVICSGAHDRQVSAIATEVGRRLAQIGRRPLHVEGESSSAWVLLDYGDFIVHVFTEEKRRYYGLDSLWGDAPRLSPGLLGTGGVAAGSAG